jgi:hypothetical protein
VIAAGAAGSGYDKLAKRYARILARHGVDLEIRNSAGAVGDLNLLRDPASQVQVALTTFGFTQPSDVDTLYSLGGIFDSAISLPAPANGSAQLHSSSAWNHSDLLTVLKALGRSSRRCRTLWPTGRPDADACRGR